MKRKKQYFFYVLFAAVSTLINIGIQKGIDFLFGNIFHWALFSSRIHENSRITYGLILQMLIATIVAFIFKYLVDKLIIFRDNTSYFSRKHFTQVFLYGSFAVITTLIFWGTELAFKYFLSFQNSQYAGAVIGLALGYTVKFILDRSFVFNTDA